MSDKTIPREIILKRLQQECAPPIKNSCSCLTLFEKAPSFTTSNCIRAEEGSNHSVGGSILKRTRVPPLVTLYIYIYIPTAWVNCAAYTIYNIRSRCWVTIV